MRRVLWMLAAVLRLIGTPIAAHPAASIMLTLVAALFAAVAGNAFYGQPGHHPRPMLATRGEGADARPVPLRATDEEGGLSPVPLVLEVQTALRATGHYRAALDGKPGSATAAAIRAFQSDYGGRVDGQASPRLLAAIRRVQESKAQVSVSTENTERVASIEDVIEAGGQTSEDRSDGAAPSVSSGAIDRSSPTDLVRRIQSGLAAAEVAELTADGVLGARTRSAIRAFEALEGLEVTGEPSPRILDRLIAIGAVE